ncbi:DegT/DnrJ/EryC1/StrS family aminotransferase [Cryobacterium adonitolivorans]|uniref:DegT/DnrJ/EryC1/StrS family aminotransferase n=1 Tax=Cryobacterium adonitolivorans TaxID=1259189 RepID=A0A4R8WFY8_9MICO|nr:DegT/DnrJ/EryC1/StrS family aminotransferase [Cryobacterium adonitolivorans]TFC07196.1 DegT/DnrJ/EryC1/StrS family aminotransferase [Cryobacterium adonitolivorans]
MRVPFLNLIAQQAEIADEVLPTWQAQFISAAFVGGAEVAAFEREYAAYIGTRHCVGVANGTDAVELALRAVGVRPGDEVIIPVNTFIATAEAATRLGAIPVFVDVDDEFLLIDPAAVDAAITARTRAIVPVHLYGQTAPMDALIPMANRHGLVIVEDAAQSQGASSTLGRAGSLGRVAATSFYPGKNLGAAGDAGAVLTDDPAVAEFVRNFGAHGSSVKYVHDRAGVNSRLDAVQAAVLRAKLRRLDGWNAARRAAAGRYAEMLADVPEVRLPAIRPGNEDVWHLYVVQVDERDRVLAELGAAGIGAAIHYPTPLHLTAAYAGLGYRPGQFPVAEAAAGRILSLPMFPHLTQAEQSLVADSLTSSVTSRTRVGSGSGLVDRALS